MKYNTIGLFVIALMSSVASAGTKFWVNEAEKIVLVAANPTLSVRLVKLEVDDNYYARLDVSLNYVSFDVSAQVNSIMNDYAGYRSQRVIVEKSGTYRYQIPLLSIARDIDPKSGIDGPYIEAEIYLTKAKYGAVQKDIEAGRPVVQLSGVLVGTVPMMKVVEHKEIDNSLCERLLGSEKTVSSTISKMALVNQSALYGSQFQFDSTRLALVRDIKENCFEITQGSRVDSFADVLSLGLRAKRLGRSLVGETMKKTYNRQDVPLVFETRQLGGE